MALFADGGPKTLEDALGSQAQNKISGIQDQYGQARKRLVAKEAAGGRLMSGVADYPLADLANEQAGAESDVYSNLANALGNVTAEDTLNMNDYNRNLNLAQMVGKLNKPSDLQQALGLLRAGGNVASMAALFA